MVNIILQIAIMLVIVGFIYLIYRSFSRIPFETHKEMNRTHYLEKSTHNDLNKFLSEFESVKSELRASKKKMFKYSLFHNDVWKDDYGSMNGSIFVINNVKYVAASYSDYCKATKVIREHCNYCVKNNIYADWI